MTRMNYDNLKVIWSDSVEMSLLSVPDDIRVKLGKAWSSPKVSFKKSPDSFKKVIENLDNQGLMLPKRLDPKLGIRKLSYVELLYLEMLNILDDLKVDDKIKKKLFTFFNQEYDKNKAKLIYTIEWLDALLSVHYGYDIEFIIQKGDISAYDVATSAFIAGPTLGQIRISLSAVVNKLNKRLGIREVKIKRGFGDLPLSSSEIDVVIESRDLKPTKEEMIQISKTNSNKVLVKSSKTSDLGDNISLEEAMKLYKDKLESNDFTDIKTIQRNGKIVKFREQTQTLYDN